LSGPYKKKKDEKKKKIVRKKIREVKSTGVWERLIYSGGHYRVSWSDLQKTKGERKGKL